METKNSNSNCITSQPSNSLKITIFGDASVGKTTITEKLANIQNPPRMEKPAHFQARSSIGSTLRKGEYYVNSVKFPVHIWDTCGDRRFLTESNPIFRLNCKDMPGWVNMT